MSTTDLEEDFGLTGDELYAPEDIDEPIDLAAPHVMTVLGPIDPAALGLTLFARNFVDVYENSSNDGELLAELEAAYFIGLRTIAFSSTEFDREKVSWVATRAPIHFAEAPAPIPWVDPDVSWSTQQMGPQILDAMSIEAKGLSGLPDHILIDQLLAGICNTPGSDALGLTNSLHRIPLALMEAGMSAVEVRRILVENPVAALTMTVET